MKTPLLILAFVGAFQLSRVAEAVRAPPIGQEWSRRVAVPSAMVGWGVHNLAYRGESPVALFGYANVIQFGRRPDGRFFIVIEVAEGRVDYLELPLLYYKGYEFRFTPTGGVARRLAYFENDRGFVTLRVSEGGTIRGRYVGTLADQIATLVSLLTLLVLLGHKLVPAKFFKARF